jgi:hypothetical protein
MRMFGPSPESAWAEQLEAMLRGSGAARALTDLPRLAAALTAYTARLERAAHTVRDDGPAAVEKDRSAFSE